MPSTKCPKCGAERRDSSSLYSYTIFECGSRLVMEQVAETFSQSKDCELSTLRAKLEKAKRLFGSIQQVAASTDGGPIIMDGRRQMIGDLARNGLTALE